MRQHIYKNLSSLFFSLTLFFTFGATQVAIAQTWTAQTSFTLQPFTSVFFTSATDGWAVGSSGVVRHTTDAGLNWTIRSLAPSTDLYCVYFVSSSLGWIVGANGLILHTDDGGVTWNTQTSPIFSRLNAVHFVSPTHGWAVGASGKVIKTTDGGATWLQSNSFSNLISFYAVHFTSATQGYITDNSDIRTTTDGGATWTAQPLGNALALRSISFVTPLSGWLCTDEGSIYATTDGGTNWTLQNSNTNTALYGIHFTSLNEGWAVGAGVILKTTNGGITWTSEATSDVLFSVHFPSANEGWAVGNNGTILAYQSCPANDTSVTENGTTLTSNATSTSYQWLDCNNGNNPISGETSQSFTAPSNGSYAVVVGQGICADTSACYAVVGVGLDKLVGDIEASIFPNPATSSLTVQTNEIIESISIFDTKGMLVQTEKQKTFSVKELPAGVYLLQLKSANKTGTTKFIKE